VSSVSGLPLCGREGYPACLSDPAAGRWVSWTVATPEPIGKLSLQCDELYLSSIVIQ
jgi:hypothetical protein